MIKTGDLVVSVEIKFYPSYNYLINQATADHRGIQFGVKHSTQLPYGLNILNAGRNTEFINYI